MKAVWLAGIALLQTALPQITLAQSTAGAASAEEAAKGYAAALAAEDFGRALSLVRPADLKTVAAPLREVLMDPVYGKNVRRELGKLPKEPRLMSDAEITAQVFSSAYAKYRELGILGAEKIKISLLGSVNETTDTVHFVQKAELTDPAKQMKEVSLISVVREGSNWYVVFPEALRNQASSFAEQLKEAADHAEMDSAR